MLFIQPFKTLLESANSDQKQYNALIKPNITTLCNYVNKNLDQLCDNNVALASFILSILNQYNEYVDSELIDKLRIVIRMQLETPSKVTLGMLAWLCVNLSGWEDEFQLALKLFSKEYLGLEATRLTEIHFPIMVTAEVMKRQEEQEITGIKPPMDMESAVIEIVTSVKNTEEGVTEIQEGIMKIDSSLANLYNLSKEQSIDFEKRLEELQKQNSDLYGFIVKVNVLTKSKLQAINSSQQSTKEGIDELIADVDILIKNANDMIKSRWQKSKDYLKSLPGEIAIEEIGALIFQFVILPLFTGSG